MIIIILATTLVENFVSMNRPSVMNLLSILNLLKISGWWFVFELFCSYLRLGNMNALDGKLKCTRITSNVCRFKHAYCEINHISLKLKKKYTLKNEQCPIEFQAPCYVIIIQLIIILIFLKKERKHISSFFCFCVCMWLRVLGKTCRASVEILGSLKGEVTIHPSWQLSAFACFLYV